MKKSMTIVLAGSAALLGGVALAGTAAADRGGFGHHGMHGGMMGGIGHEMLRSVDTNADGALSQEEIDAAVDGRFAEFDANTDGKLSLAEFQALWAEVTKPISVRAFQFLDPDGDAAVAKVELEERFGSAVAHFDRNDDGVLSQQDRRHRRWGWRGGGEGDDE
jgi:Ca2+-binding EF-hand superfamily protein